MTYLLVFIAGMLFYGVIIPLIEAVLEYVETNKEVFMSSKSVIVAQNNSLIQKLQSENEQSSVSAIGYECPSFDEYEDDEEHEEDRTRNKRKAGFQYV